MKTIDKCSLANYYLLIFLKNKSILLIITVGLILGCNSNNQKLCSKKEVIDIEQVRVIDNLTLTMPLSIAFTDNLEIIVGDIFLFRQKGSNDGWQTSPADSTGAHSLTWKRNAGDSIVYYAVGTNKNQLLEFDHLSFKPSFIGVETLPVLNRPHDIIYNPKDDYFYFINADYISPHKLLIRFKNFESGFETLDLTNFFKEKDNFYARSLSLINDKIYIIVSSYGEVIRIDDFEQNKYTYYQSNPDRKPAPAGSYSKTGLVLNDIEYFNGYWYGSNYFCSSYADGTDYYQNRLIRWKTWGDFKEGRFEDVSSLLDRDMVPYYFTIEDELLYLAAFPDESLKSKNGGKIYVFSGK